jgi:hypothetical protein
LPRGGGSDCVVAPKYHCAPRYREIGGLSHLSERSTGWGMVLVFLALTIIAIGSSTALWGLGARRLSAARGFRVMRGRLS